MNIFTFLSSASKLALIAFIITFVAIGYELFLIIKQSRKKTKVSIPEFKQGKDDLKLKEVHYTRLPEKDIVGDQQEKEKRMKIIMGLFIILFLFAAVFIMGNYYNNNKDNIDKKSTPDSTQSQSEQSKGITIFNRSFNVINDEKIGDYKSGDTIIIGIYTIEDSPIDKARIRINESRWNNSHETTQYNQENKVFYIQYLIGALDKELKIEAQLHSKSEGWLE